MENIVQGQWFRGPSADLGTPIDQSLRFAPSSQSSGPYLHKTGFSNSGDVWTFSCWMKGWGPAGTTAQWSAVLFSWHNNSSGQSVDELAIFGNYPATGRNEINYYFEGANAGNAYSNAEFQDPSAWYHVVWQSSSTSAVKLYVNNVEITDWRTSGSVTAQNFINKNQTCSIGARAPGSTSPSGAQYHGEGYLAAAYFIDGTAKSPSDFGKYNKDGVWVPQNYTGSYGTNGFHLTFDSSQANGIGHDSSGNGNNFTATGFDEYYNAVNVYFPVTGTASTAALGTTLRGTTPNGNGGSSIQVTSTNHMDVDFGRSATSHTLTITNSGAGVTIYVSPDGTENSWVASNVTNASFTSGQTITANDNSAFRYLRFTCSSYSVNNVTAPVGDNVYDIDFFDTPTSNYATLNPLFSNADHTPRYFGITKDANLAADTSGSQADWATTSNIELTDGKWYFEVTYTTRALVGIAGGDDRQNNRAFIEAETGNYTTQNSFGTSGPTSNSGSQTSGTIGCRVDITNRTLAFTWDGSTYTSNLTYSDPGHKIFPYISAGAQQPTNNTIQINHGQMPFIYSVPTGFEGALQTNNLPEPTIKNGRDYFDVITYTGNGSDSHAITGLNFQPDLVWIKPRSVVDNHRLMDSVRGVTTHLVPNSIDDEPTTNAQILESFDAGDGSDGSGGFTLNGTDAGWNGNTSTYVAWCWKAGESFTPSQTGGLTNLSGSRNTEAGFSIISYTGSGANATVGHGLTTAPELVIVKGRDSDDEWHVKHSGLSSNNHSVRFNSTAAEANFSVWQNTAPTNSVFSIGSQDGVNQNTEKFIAYCWHSVEGYSKFDLYVGNNSADGPFVYTGFRPAFVLIKRKDNSFGGEWSIFDSTRNPSNPADLLLSPTTTGNERTGQAVDFLSNGFKIRKVGDWYNQLNGQYIYAAFAENPFGGKNAPPATAR